MPAGRTPEQVRKDIETERRELASAVDELRGSLGHAADITGRLKERLPVVAGAAVTTGFNGCPACACVPSDARSRKGA